MRTHLLLNSIATFAMALGVGCTTRPPEPNQQDIQAQLANWGEDSSFRMKAYTGWKGDTPQMNPYGYLTRQGVLNCNWADSFYPSCSPAGNREGGLRIENPPNNTMMVVRVGTLKSSGILQVERVGPRTANVLVSTRLESNPFFEQYKEVFADIEKFGFGEHVGAATATQKWVRFEFTDNGKWVMSR
jgi:hypothetical protein